MKRIIKVMTERMKMMMMMKKMPNLWENQLTNHSNRLLNLNSRDHHKLKLIRPNLNKFNLQNLNQLHSLFKMIVMRVMTVMREMTEMKWGESMITMKMLWAKEMMEMTMMEMQIWEAIQMKKEHLGNNSLVEIENHIQVEIEASREEDSSIEAIEEETGGDSSIEAIEEDSGEVIGEDLEVIVEVTSEAEIEVLEEVIEVDSEVEIVDSEVVTVAETSVAETEEVIGVETSEDATDFKKFAYLSL